MNEFRIRPATAADAPAAYHVCLKTGDHGEDAEHLLADDPDALGRIYVGPYLAFEPELSLVVEDQGGICGYALGALDSRAFYQRYETDWRPALCAAFPDPRGERAQWSRAGQVHHCYHHPDYFCPGPYGLYPSHLHIDLLPRAQGRGLGRRMMQQNLQTLRRLGSPGAHLGLSPLNTRARAFYEHLGFHELTRVGDETDGCIYMGIGLKD